MTDVAGGAPVDRQPAEVPSGAPVQPAQEPQPPPWTRTLTRLVALGWGSCELALWGARPQALGFIAAMILGTEGVVLVARLRDLLR